VLCECSEPHASKICEIEQQEMHAASGTNKNIA
jgi:hypothetical protein